MTTPSSPEPRGDPPLYIFVPAEGGPPFVSSSPSAGDLEFVRCGLLQILRPVPPARMTPDGDWEELPSGVLTTAEQLGYDAEPFHIPLPLPGMSLRAPVAENETALPAQPPS